MSNFFEITPFTYEYVQKEAFWLFLLIPIILVWYLYHESSLFKNINISTLQTFDKKKFNWLAFFRHINLFVFITGLSFIILALARPHVPEDIDEYKKKNLEGIDIVIAMDVSESMLARDLKPDRLGAAKETAIDFIEQRPSDRIGLVVYEGDAYTQAPLTNDHNLLISLFEEVEPGMVTPGTAIGLGLATAVNRLRESDAKSKVIILLTDGINNSGDIDPLTAAKIAKEFNICVYTIGVGKEGAAPFPMTDFFGGTVIQNVEIPLDAELLQEIAGITGGKFYRAENETELSLIYDEIDLLEKSKVKVLEYKVNPPEKYYGLLFLGILLVLVYKVVHHTLLKSIP